MRARSPEPRRARRPTPRPRREPADDLTSRQKTALALIGLGDPLPAPAPRACCAPRARRWKRASCSSSPSGSSHGDLPNQDFLHLYGPGQPLGARRRLQGVRHPARDRAALRAARSRSASCSGCSGWPASGAARSRCSAAVIALDHHRAADRAHRARVGRRRRARAPRRCSPTLARAGDGSRDATRRAALGWALVGGLVAGLRAAVPARSRRRGRARRCSPRCGAPTRASSSASAPGSRSASPATSCTSRWPGRTTSSRAWCSTPSSTCAAGAGSRCRRRGTTSTASCRSPAAIMPDHWPIPALTTSAQLTVWFFLLLASVVFLLVVGDLGRAPGPELASRPASCSPSRCSASAWCPRRMQRVDSAHFAWVSCVPFAFVPVAVLELLRARSPGRSYRRQAILSGGGAFARDAPRDPAVHRLGVHGLRRADVRPAPPRVPDRARTAAPSTTAGSRSRTRRASCSPRCRRSRSPVTGCSSARPTCARRRSPRRTSTTCSPSTRPRRTTSRWIPAWRTPRTRGLASDLRSADIAILSGAWNDWDEPNDSRKLGSDEPNHVLADDFCLVGSYGVYRTGDPLYELLEAAPQGPTLPAGTTKPNPPGI